MQELVEVDALTTARTVGSTNSGGGGSNAFSGPVVSTAAGGGGDTTGESLDFFVLENSGLIFDDVRDGLDLFACADGVDCTPTVSLGGGTERVVGDSSDTDVFALLRLGQRDLGGRDSFADRADQPGQQGYAAGFVEVVTPDGLQFAPFGPQSADSNLVFGSISDSELTFSAAITGGGVTHILGGSEASAYVPATVSGTPERFAARSVDPAVSDLAVVSGDLVDEGFRMSGDPRLAYNFAAGADYDHLRWGFFFGDALRVTDAGDVAQSHVHLGSFVSGVPIDAAELAGAQGTATYTGHAVGNVYNAGEVYTATGTFRDEFDFGSRAGQASLGFDGRTYTGVSGLDGTSYSSNVDAGGGFEGRLDGQFFGPGGTQPEAVGGQFSLTNGADAADTAYRATGTFAGEK